MSVELEREMEARDQTIREQIKVAASGGYYELNNPYLTAKQKDQVEGWFQFPLNVQTITVLVLMLAGYRWWTAILLAWIPSTIIAIGTRSTRSTIVGEIGHLSRWAAQLTCIGFGFYMLVHDQWIMLAVAAVAFLGLLGMLCPAMAIMSNGPDRWHSKYSYASRAFGVEFPFQLAARRLDEIASEPPPRSHLEMTS